MEYIDMHRGRERRSSKPLKFARDIARDLVEKEVVGAILFGSFAKGVVDEMSDLDLALIVEGEGGLKEVVVEDLKVEVWEYNLKHFLHTFEDEEYRDREDSWFLTSLWIKILREGVILEDPRGILSKWRERALKWRWRREEIVPVVDRAKKCIAVAKRTSSRGELFKGIVAIRDSFYNLTIAYVMALNRIPSIRPKDLYEEVKEIEFKKMFDRVQGLEDVDRDLVEELLNELRDLLNRVGKSKRGARTEYENALKSLRRGKVKEALLNARYCAFYIGVKMLKDIGTKVRSNPYDAEFHTSLLDWLKDKRDFISTYYRLHATRKLDHEYLNECIRLAEESLVGLSGILKSF